jgi:hypothetical protein
MSGWRRIKIKFRLSESIVENIRDDIFLKDVISLTFFTCNSNSLPAISIPSPDVQILSFSPFY